MYDNRYATLLAFIFASQLQAKQITLNCEIVGSEGLHSHSLEGTTINAKKEAGIYRISQSDYDKWSDKCLINYGSSQQSFPTLTTVEKSTLSSKTVAVGSEESYAAYQNTLKTYSEIERDPERTMVIFFHGTGSNPIDDLTNPSFPDYDYHNDQTGGGELLSFLEEKMRQEGATKGTDFLVLHGAGSGNLQNTKLHDHFFASQSYSFSAGQLMGSGVEENIQHAIMHLKGVTKNPALETQMAEQGQKIRQVGRLIIIGWSRGAVTAIKFARDLYKDPELKELDVHLLAIDPVPGMGNISLGLWKNIFHLYPNVKHYLGIYAQDERSVGFTPLLPQEVNEKGSKTTHQKNRIIMEMPGNHSSLVGNTLGTKFKKETTTSIKEIEASARLVRGLAQAYIVENGGFMESIHYHLGKSPNSLSDLPELMLKDFNNVLKSMNTFHNMRQESYTGTTQVFSGFRKYHEEWNLGLKALNAIFRPIAPRYSSKDLDGFLLRGNYENDRFEKKQLWVNHLHKTMGLMKANKTLDQFDIKQLFSNEYYDVLKRLNK